jgi:hypothetical protein
MPSGVFYFNIYTHNAINYHMRQHVGLCVCSVTIYISMLGQKKKKNSGHQGMQLEFQVI